MFSSLSKNKISSWFDPTNFDPSILNADMLTIAICRLLGGCTCFLLAAAEGVWCQCQDLDEVSHCEDGYTYVDGMGTCVLCPLDGCDECACSQNDPDDPVTCTCNKCY